jgi:quercetin dioxygenase-like cupin family protein
MTADLAEFGVDLSHHFVADEVYSKRTVVPAGVQLAKHTHPYDHASALVRGTVRLTIDGASREVSGPKMLLIAAGTAHSIEALTPVVWHCIHITDETDPERIDAVLMEATA